MNLVILVCDELGEVNNDVLRNENVHLQENIGHYDDHRMETQIFGMGEKTFPQQEAVDDPQEVEVEEVP